MPDILNLFSIHFSIQMLPRGGILYLSLESVGESSGSLDLEHEHERTSCSILWDLGPPCKNLRTEEPLITTSLLSVQHWRIQYPANQITKHLLRTLSRLSPCAVTCVTSCWSLKSHVVYGRATLNLANLVELFFWLPSDDPLVLSSTGRRSHKGGIDPNMNNLSEHAVFV